MYWLAFIFSLRILINFHYCHFRPFITSILLSILYEDCPSSLRLLLSFFIFAPLVIVYYFVVNHFKNHFTITPSLSSNCIFFFHITIAFFSICHYIFTIIISHHQRHFFQYAIAVRLLTIFSHHASIAFRPIVNNNQRRYCIWSIIQ